MGCMSSKPTLDREMTSTSVKSTGATKDVKAKPQAERDAMSSDAHNYAVYVGNLGGGF